MSIDFTIAFRENYLHMQLAPGHEITPEDTDRQWSAIIDACVKSMAAGAFYPKAPFSNAE